MDRISGANATPGGLFQDGNPGTGQRATSLNARWCNDVQETLLHPIELSGREPAAETPNQLYRAMVDLIYAVGDYLHTESDVTPAQRWPWQTWAEVPGRVLVGRDEAQAEFDAVGKQGGVKAHQLSAAEMPAHGHRLWAWADAGSSSAADGFLQSGDVAVAGEADWTHGYLAANSQGRALIEPAGDGQPHNNLQPYRTVRMWRRTA